MHGYFLIAFFKKKNVILADPEKIGLASALGFWTDPQEVG